MEISIDVSSFSMKAKYNIYWVVVVYLLILSYQNIPRQYLAASWGEHLPATRTLQPAGPQILEHDFIFPFHHQKLSKVSSHPLPYLHISVLAGIGVLVYRLNMSPLMLHLSRFPSNPLTLSKPHSLHIHAIAVT